MKERLFRVIRRYGVLLGVGVAYFVFVTVTRIGIPCPFRLITGLQCPGCGVSRMMLALARLDLVSAFAYNPVVLLTAPILLYCLIRSDIDYIRTGRSSVSKYNFVWISETVILIVFGVVRNFY